MSNKNMDEITFKILYENLCLGVSQEKLAEKYKYDGRYDSQGKISRCVIEHGFHTGVPGFQAREARKHLLGLPTEEFRRLIVGYDGSSDTKLEDFFAHINKINSVRQQKAINQKPVQQQTATNQRPVQQNKQQQSWYDSLQKDVTPQYSNPAPVAAPSQLTIGELCRLSPDELTPQQLATLKAAGYVYEQIIRSWRSPEEIAEDKAASEYYARKEAEKKAKAEHDAKMAAAGYVKVGNVFDGYQWISQEEAWLQAAATLAMEKGRLTEYVMNQVNAGELEFDVALLGHKTPGSRPEHTVSFQEIITEKRKHLGFLPDKKIPVAKTCPSFNLLQTATNGNDITDVNSVYLIPRGYRIAKVSVRGNLQRPDFPDAIIVRLTCEDLRNLNNASIKCPQCGDVNRAGSIFCSKCGTKLGQF